MSERPATTRPSEGRPGPDDDLPLLDRILGGDAQAFEELVQRHKRRVYRVAMAITGNHEDAEEAMQQTFLRVYQHLGGFGRASKFTTWLTRIAMNEALQKRRRQRKTESLDDLMTTDEGVMPKQLQEWRDTPERIYSRDRLRAVREGKNLSQSDIEKRTGLLRCYISRVENGHTVPAIETVEKFARALEVPLYQLFYDGQTPPELPNLPKRKTAEDIAWGTSGKDARFLSKVRRYLSRVDERDRRLLLSLAHRMVTRKNTRSQSPARS